MTNPNILELPQGVQLVYLAEGGANVIYRFVANPSKSSLVVRDPKRSVSSIVLDEHSTVPLWLRGKLLRLRKETAADISYKEINRNFNTIVRPLFKSDELVDQSLILLPHGLIQRCNEQLRAAEISGQRPKKRVGGYLCLDEPFGLLITDMTTFDEPGTTLAELKPKWLTQSPSAPPTAHRCRTCALREMKNHDARSIGLKEQRSFCPLDLVSECFEDILRATTFIKGCGDRARLARILLHNPVLQRLRAQQTSWSQVGLLGPPSHSQKTSLDMTLRDCTMFIKVPHDDKVPVEIRLGDLDLKTGAGGKSNYWRKLEVELIDGGWYSGFNTSQDPSECALQRPNTPITPDNPHFRLS
ncbi:Inositol-pentakisphosphate 2-kinase [Penicillium angulare]|uniref:Inositol-pentakisphosphate 2-kinase n=1 Tax=Penicillium angulare TaxID=116970 RepID=A0A9W9K4Y9_9EURO|nr:Inositol-pentakisphosphate 2-kinase [Penicillium angulare]